MTKNYFLTSILVLLNLLLVNIAVGQIANAGPDQAITCVVNEVMLGSDSTSVGPNIMYEWTAESGAFISQSGNQFIDVFQGDIFFLKVTDNSSGQMAFDTVVVSENFELPNISINQPEILSCANPTVTLESSTDNPALATYEWAGVNGSLISTEANIIVSLAGLYTLIVTNTESGCSEQSSVAVLEDMNAPDVSITPPGPLDPGGSTLLVGTSTSPAVTYEWADANGNVLGSTPTLQINSIGTYCLTVTDPNNACETSTCVEVIANGTIVADAGPDQVLNCINPSVTIGGSNSSVGAGISYSWTNQNGAAISSSPTAVVQINGTYTLTVTNNQTGASDMDVVVVTSNEVEPSISIASPEILTCQNSTITIFANSSSSGTLSYAWNTFDGNIVSSSSVQNISVDAPGNYELILTNIENGCTSTESVDVDSDFMFPTVTIATPAPLTPGQTINLDGSASSQGPSFTYTWSTTNGNIISGTNTLLPLINSAGTYCLSVLDMVNGCEITSCVDVINDNAIVANAGPDQTLTCVVVEVTLDGSGSTAGPNISYSWLDPMGTVIGTSQTINVSETGTYTLTVTNTMTGANNISSVEVTNNTFDHIVSISNLETLTCETPSLNLTATTDIPGLEAFQWSGVNGNVLSTEANVVINEAGEYIIHVTNIENGCIVESSVIVQEDTEIPDVSITPPAPLDPGGTIILIGNSNSPNVTYEWFDSNNVSLGSTPTLQINSIGTYCLTVTDPNNGCENMACVEVVTGLGTMPFVVISTPPMLNPGATIQIDGSGSSQGLGFNYEWTTVNGNIIAGQNTLVATVDRGGDYCLNITNMTSGESSSACTEVIKINILFADAGSDQTLSCGEEIVTIGGHCTSEGNEYAFFWTDENGSIISSSPFTEVDSPGVYTLTVTNVQTEESLTDFTEVFIDENMLALDLTIEDVSCFGLEDGSVDIAISGGAPPYSFEFPIIGPSTQNLPAGAYSVSITDANDCIITTDFTIIEPEELILEFTVSSENEIIAEVIGGISPYTYEWNNGVDSATIVNPVNGQNYELSITDANGCMLMDEFLFVFDAVNQVNALPLYSYPNPTADYVFIEFENISSQLTHFELLDLQGKTVQLTSTFTNQNTMQLSLENLSAGTYFINAVIDDKLFYQKLLIQK